MTHSHKNAKHGLTLFLIVLIVFVFVLYFFLHHFALSVMNNSAAPSANIIQYNRNVTVEFSTTSARANPFIFYPAKNEITLHPGQQVRAYFYVQNRTDEAQSFLALASSAPSNSARYLSRFDDFSAKNITVAGGQTLKLFVDLSVDTHIPSGANLVTLNYTLFPSGNA